MAVQLDAGRAPDMLSMLAATGKQKNSRAAGKRKTNSLHCLRRTDSVNNNDDDIGPDMLTRAGIAHSSSSSLASTHHQSLEAPLLVFEPRFGLPLACRLSSTPEAATAAEAEAGALQLLHTMAATWRRGCHRQSVWRWCWHMDAPLLFGQITWSRHDTRSLSSLRLLIGYFATPAAAWRWRLPLCGLQPKFKYFDCIYDT